MRTKGYSDKKGISLIVLVITIIIIIILAVAVILSIANNNPIENAKEARFKNDVRTMQEELELLKASNYVENNGAGYNDSTTGNQIGLSDLKSSTNYTDDFEVKDGELYIKSKNNLTDKEKEWANELGVEKSPITFTGDLVLGGEVEASNGEQFYVIGGDDTVGTIPASTQDILLLAKYNLTSDGSSQDKTGKKNEYGFSRTAYWSSVSGITYPVDLNDVEKYPIPDTDTISVIKKAKTYGEDVLGAKEGRLMTYEEAQELQQANYLEILYGNKEGNKLNYWLSSARSERDVWTVFGEFSSLNDYLFVPGNICGTRPVIKVSKSLFQ